VPLLNTVTLSYCFFHPFTGWNHRATLPQGQVDLVRDVRIEDGLLVYNVYGQGSESVSNRFPGVRRIGLGPGDAISYLVKAADKVGADTVQEFVEMHEGEGVEVVLW